MNTLATFAHNWQPRMRAIGWDAKMKQSTTIELLRH